MRNSLNKTVNFPQDLNEKFQELESKMFEVEKCFKEVNKREMDEVQRLMNDQSESESIPRSRLFEVGDGRKEMSGYPADGIKRWLGHHNPTVTEKRAYEDRIVGDGSGDTLVLPNKASSEVSCKTMIKTTEKSPVNLSNRHGNAKGIFTIPYQFNDEPHGSAKQYTFEETNKQTTDVDFLEKSKKLILTLIDKELKKIETKPNDCSQSNVNQEAKKLARDNDNKNLKIACINKIERELSALKKLESLEQ